MKIDKEKQNKNTFIFGKKDLEIALKKYLSGEGKYTKVEGEKTTFLLNGKDCVELSVEMTVINYTTDSEEI